jgi:hypothetical protein
MGTPVKIRGGRAAVSVCSAIDGNPKGILSTVRSLVSIFYDTSRADGKAP